MDKVKAIKVLKPLIDSYVDYANISMKEEDDNIVEALEMAIEALKALDVPDTNVGDMISRQMAIDALFELYEYQRYIDPTEAADRVRQGVYLAEKKIEQLPSVQPEWNNHTVACLLAELFDDTCACNYNGIDEWLPEKCELFKSCPNPVGVACWEQFLKHRVER